MINELKDLLSRQNFIFLDDVYFERDIGDQYVSNFSKQWKDFSKTQVDEFNGTTISRDLLKGVIFDEFDNLQDKCVLEVGCGSGRFTEHIAKYASSLIINDMSKAINYNHFRAKHNVLAIKSDFTNLKKLNLKFDIIICRGVLQHTPNPLNSILELLKLCKYEGSVYFDIYKKPKLRFFNSKYIWRRILKNKSYEDLYKFLDKNIDIILSIRRKINNLLKLNLNFFWDYLFPIYDYKDRLPLNNLQLREWAILDTLDGLVTKYDTPYTYSEIRKFLDDKNIVIDKFDLKYHSFKIINNENQ